MSKESNATRQRLAALHEALGVLYARLHGQMSPAERHELLEAIGILKGDPDLNGTRSETATNNEARANDPVTAGPDGSSASLPSAEPFVMSEEEIIARLEALSEIPVHKLGDEQHRPWRVACKEGAKLIWRERLRRNALPSSVADTPVAWMRDEGDGIVRYTEVDPNKGDQATRQAFGSGWMPLYLRPAALQSATGTQWKRGSTGGGMYLPIERGHDFRIAWQDEMGDTWVLTLPALPNATDSRGNDGRS